MAFSMGSGGGGDDLPQMAEINIIPLVDVMLVLLIIMMVTAPFMEQGVNVELPSTQQGQNLRKDSTQNDPLVLYVTKSENLRLGNDPVPRAQLAERLAAAFKDKSSRELFVRADKSVPYGVVADVMARVQAAGIERVGLVTQSEE